MRWVLSGATVFVVLLLILQAVEGDRDWACTPRAMGTTSSEPAVTDPDAALADYRVPHDTLVRVSSTAETVRYQQLVDDEIWALLDVTRTSSGGYVVSEAFGCSNIPVGNA